MRIKSAGNTGFASGGVTCKLGALCFYSGSVLVDSFVLRNPPERKARNRWAQAKKEMKSYRILLFIFTCGLSTAIYGQANENVPIESLKLLCKNDSINICIPKGYLSTDTFNYMEGYIQTFIYPDSSTVSILCGANATLNIGEYEVDELYSRKIKYKYHDMTYERVTPEMKAVFDESFDIMEKKN